MNREQIYDEILAPKVDELIELCDKHDIPTMIHFCIDHDGEQFRATSVVCSQDGHNNMPLPQDLILAMFVLTGALKVPQETVDQVMALFEKSGFPDPVGE